MKKRVRYSLLAMSLIMLSFIAATLWFLGTPGGVRWLFSFISERSTIRVSAGAIEGRLWGDLGIEKLYVRWPGGFATVEHLHIRWQPLSLVLMQVSSEEIAMRQVYIQDNTPEKPVDLTWPSVSGIPSLLSGKIAKLSVKGLMYRRLDQRPLAVSGISSAAWSGGALSLKNLSLSLPALSVRGTASAGFARPSLKADLLIEPAKPGGKLKALSLKADLTPSSSPAQLRGPISLVAALEEKNAANLSAELAVERKALVLNKLSLFRSGAPGAVTGEGRISFAGAAPEFESRLKIEGLDLSPEVQMKTEISGTIGIKGTAEDYKGELYLTNMGESWEAAGIAGRFDGNTQELKIEIDKGIWLKGRLSGVLQADWRKRMKLKWSLKARDLNPAVIRADWTGDINLDVSASVDLSHEETEGSVKAQVLESRLHGKKLTGSLDAGFRGRDVSIADLFLRGRGFDLRAKGELQKRLTFGADISNLSFLVPGAQGSLRAQGWMRMEEGNFSGEVSGEARAVAYKDIRVKTASLSASLSPSKRREVGLKADIRGISYKNVVFDRCVLLTSGTTMNHKIALDASRKGSFEFHTALEGSYDNNMWAAKIMHLKGRDATGSFALEAPAGIILSRTEMSLSAFSLRGVGPERVSSDIEIDLSGKSVVKTSIERFNLARINQWLTGRIVTGVVSGKFGAELQMKTMTNAAATLSGAGVFSSSGESVRVEKGALTLKWDNRGLDGSVRITLAKGGFLIGKIESPLPPVPGLPSAGNLHADWKEANLVLLSPLLADGTMISGGTTGTLSAGWKKKDIASLNVEVRAYGTFSSSGETFGIRRSDLKIDWNSGGLSSTFDVEPSEGGLISGRLFSQGKPHLALPDRGEITADLKNFNPAVFKRWLPQDIAIKGGISGHAAGKILPGRSLNFSGNIALGEGSLTYRTAKGIVSAEMKTAGIAWTWQGDSLQGDVSLALAEYGSIKGHFGLPIPARVPISLNQAGPLKTDLSAKMKENGLLTSFFPGMIRESHGDLDLSLKVTGTWSAPVLAGNFQLQHAGGFFPSTVTKIENVLMKGHFETNKVVVDDFQAESGKGKLNGTAYFLLDKWRIKSYSGTVTGDNFRALYLPDLRAEISPELNFTGDGKKLSMRGDISVTNLLVAESKAPLYVEPSKDVILIDQKKEQANKTPFPLDIEVHVMFKDTLFVKAEGIDAQLKGNILVTARDINDISGKGSLEIVKGTYKNYGVDLKIERGLVSFTDGKIGNPSLDALALRTIDEIRAGVIVYGTLEKPVVKLYSNPTMPQTDILAYIVFGHPLGGGSSEQASILMKVAGTLLSKGEGPVIQDQLKKKFGLDILDVESGGKTEAGAARSLLTVGKYLTPKLFISYGQSLFKSGNLFKMRYSLSKHFDVESQSGIESGVDLVYKIELK